jgi:hypothetical protein
MNASLPIGWAHFLEPSGTALALASACVAFGAWRIAAPAPSCRERVLGLGIWSAVWIVASVQILSLAGALHWPAALALAAAGACAARWGLSARPRPVEELPAAVRTTPAGEVWWLLAFALPGVLYALWSAWLVVVSAEPLGDNTNYHIPRLAYWMQHQSIAPFPSNDPRISTFPVVANVLQLWPALFLEREQLGGLVQLAAHLGTALCVYGLARDLGAERPAGAAAGLCWLAVPVALHQATTSNVDVVAAFFAAAASALAVGCLRRGGAWLAWTCFASACLAVGAKPHTLPLAAPCAMVALLALWRVRRTRALRALPALLLLATLVAGLHLVQNHRAFGSASGLASVQWVVLNPGLPTLAKNLQLVLLPLTGGRGFDGAFSPWPLPQGLIGHGLGAPWLLLGAAGVAVAAVRGIRTRRGRGLPLAYAAIGLAYAGTVLFTLRHQPSVDRFLLPAAAVLTPLLSFLFVGRARVPMLACVWTMGSWTLLHWSRLDLAQRSTSDPRPRFWSYADAQGTAELATLARAADRLAAEARGRRIGLVTPQGAFQRLLLGPRFENVLVPLSHDPPLELAAADRLRLDALMISVPGSLALQLFRPRFVTPRYPPSDGWRLTARDSFDSDFLRAYELAVEYPDFERTARLFGRPGSGWSIDPGVRSGALFFVRRSGARAALALTQVVGARGLEDVNGRPFSRVGTGTTNLVVFAGAGGSAVFQARIRRGPHLRGDRAQVEIVRAGGERLETTAVIGTRLSAPVSVRAGLNIFALRVPRAPGDPANEDRVEQLGLVNLRVRWAAEGTADDEP